MWSDFRNALRSLSAEPSFTLIALAVLALGVGATTAIFSVVDTVVLRGMPFDEGDRLVAIHESRTRLSETGFGPVAPQNFLEWKQQQDVFDGLAAVAGALHVYRGGEEALEIRSQRVSHELFSVLRAQPRIGRAFGAEHEVEGRHRVVLLSDGLWRQLFGADPQAIGQTLKMDDGIYEVVGVMPPGFTYPIGTTNRAEMWVPYVVPPDHLVRDQGRNYYLQVVGRLKDGVTLEQARARIEQITAALAAEYPKWFEDLAVAVRSLHEAVVGSVRSWMLMLLGAVVFVLLIASVNVANLMLARATRRGRELGIRAALGATRARLMRALLVESVVLSVAGTLAGVAVAWWGVAILRSAIPSGVPRVAEIAVDLRVLAAAGMVALLTGVLLGLAPAIQFSRPDLMAMLQDGSRTAGAGRGRQALRNGLIVAEVALAVVLLVGSGLFISSFVRLVNVDLGIDVSNVVTLNLPVRGDRRLGEMGDEEQRRFAGQVRNVVQQVLERAAQVPGVELASVLTGGLPLSGSWSRTSVEVPGNPTEFRGDDAADIRRVTPDYLKALRVPLLRGRFFTEQDREGAPPVIILNDVAAKRYFPDADPLGATIKIGESRTIVGIVQSIRLGGPESQPRPEAYAPAAQSTMYGGDLVVRTTGDPMVVLPGLKAVVLSILPGALIREAQTLEGYFDRLIAQRRFNMMMISLFGALGLVIAAIGIYGVMAYVVEQRTQEIGVRMALGAQPEAILRSVLGRAGLYLGLGLAAGLASAWVLSRWVQAMLFQVQGTDPLIYGGMAVLLAVVGWLAAFVPARRASRVDPLVALRVQ